MLTLVANYDLDNRFPINKKKQDNHESKFFKYKCQTNEL